MKKIVDTSLLQMYLDHYQLNEIFEGQQDLLEMYQADKGEMVYSSGQKVSKLLFLVKGKLKIYTDLPNGKSLLVRFSNPLSLMGDLEFINQCDAINNVESVHDCLFISLDYPTVLLHFNNKPEFLQFLLKQIGYKLYTFANSTSLNLLFPVENRFASYLVSTLLDEKESLSVHELKTAKLTEIAGLLGTSYRHLNRVIEKMMAQNIIGKRKGILFIKDSKRLKELSSGKLYE